MHFIAVDITLRKPSPRTLTVKDAPYAHAAVLNAISQIDEVAGRRLHDMKRHKPITIALVDPVPSLHNAACLRVAIMNDAAMDYTSIILEALAIGQPLHLGRTIVNVDHVAISGTRWSGVATWADLLQPSAHPTICFEFVTPTAIMKHDENNKRFSSLLTTPRDIFNSLGQRWQSLNGPSLPDDLNAFLDKGGCFVSHSRTKTTTFHTRERTQIGFIGSVTYQCRTSDPVYVTALNALARLAFFTGVGYQTARGMGLVRTTVGRTA
jgi:CRISPR-associated endoribonuclease Cas6